MNSPLGGTVTTTKSSDSPTPAEAADVVGQGALLVRAESNPAARKRRLAEQDTAQTSKAPKRGCPVPGEDETTIVPGPAEVPLHEDMRLSTKPPMHPDMPKKRQDTLIRRDDSARLRKTIQWLEEGARRLRDDLAAARSELYEERKASKLLKREIDQHVREARALEAAKHQKTINELRVRLSQSPSRDLTQLHNAKSEVLRDDNHKREISAARKRLANADETIRKLKSSSLDQGGGSGTKKRRKLDIPSHDLRRMENELRCLRETNKKLEEKLQIVTEAERARAIELRVEHENHEAEICALKKAQRTDIIKMMEELRSKERDIEKLEKLARRKWRAREDELMRKLRESERGHQVRLGPRIEDKIKRHENNETCNKNDYDVVGEVDRLRELTLEQQDVIDYLRQALKERERKLDQLSNKKRKEEFYKQWLELEPVAEVDDEEEHEDDSALSSGPSSLSPQPQQNGVPRETYEALLLEFEELQSKHSDDQEELSHLKIQVRDLEKALLQETRGSQNSRRALSEKLRESEDRESCLLAEISELKEQNELLEFRVLELEELRESPDTADSGIVSPEPIQLFKDQKQHRAIATVIPYNSYNQSLSPVPAHKPLLSLQESGIFEEDDDHSIELSTCGTQTETPAGDLLQEVQKLQELREKIQERAVKVPVPFDEIEDNRMISLKERIRELEDRLGWFEAAETKRSEDQLIAKQREEDLLDENYRLTERVYWLENELQNMVREKSDVATMTEAPRTKDCGITTELSFCEQKIVISEQISVATHCGKLFYDNLNNLNDSEVLCAVNNQTELLNSVNNIKCEKCDALRKICFDEMGELKRKELAFVKTLRQVDDALRLREETRLREEEERQRKIEGMVRANDELNGKIRELEGALHSHVCQVEVDMGEVKNSTDMWAQTDELMEIDEQITKSGRIHRFTQTETELCGYINDVNVIKETPATLLTEVALEAREDEDPAKTAVSRVHLTTDTTPDNNHETVELISESDKKVRKFRNCRRERDGWAMRGWITPRGSRSVKGVRAIVSGHRFVLYPEICV